MRAYFVVNAETGRVRDLAKAIASLPGVRMADACWGVGDVYGVLEFDEWKDLNALVLEKIRQMPGVTRTETHVAVGN